MYGEGISKVGEILDLGVDLNIIKKSGSWFSYGETRLGQGRDAVKNVIHDNPDLMLELEEQIKSAIVPSSSPSKTEKVTVDTEEEDFV
jgi:recombination protein RecA